MIGDVPIGAGLSSSAAVEMATARAFVSQTDWQPAAMARLGQLAENRWMGVNSGIMDQMISAAGQANHALLIDCRTLETEATPLPAETAVVILDTNTRRGLVDSAYNERRQQCETAAAYFGVSALRDVDLATFQEGSSGLDEIVRRRAKHVIAENGRVLQAKTAMQQGDASALGQLLNASHRSLRDDFEVSSTALDTIVDLAQNHPACYGARMTGAGFGGCAVALINTQTDVQDFVDQISIAYQTQMQVVPSIFICQAMDGASLSVL
jgi:galactokinase